MNKSIIDKIWAMVNSLNCASEDSEEIKAEILRLLEEED